MMDYDTIRARMIITDSDPTLDEIEYALDHGMLWVLVGSGRYWLARRNGATKRWKREPDRFELPVKSGMRNYGRLFRTSEVGIHVGYAYVVSQTNPTPTKRK
jgi:hypothetical protein